MDDIALISAILGHRRELENPAFTHTGLGIFKDGKGVIYWTQMMVRL